MASAHSPFRGPPEVALSVVLLTWNSARHLGYTLAALDRELEGMPTEIILIDNGSVDDSIAIAEAQVPRVRVVRNATNQGVARARNQGLALAAGRYLLFLDSDAEPAPGSVRAMVQFLETRDSVGVVGPKLVSPTGAVQLSCRRFPTLPGKLMRQLPLRLRTTIAWVADEEMHGIDRTKVQPVDYVIGACQLIRREVIEAAGPLDERMFYGPEDVDLCLRAWRAGWEVYYVPSAVVVHHEQRIARRLSMLTLRHGVALGYYFWKHRYIWRRPSRTSRRGETRR